MWLLGMVAAAAGTASAPVYLSCEFAGPQSSWVVDVAVDEAHQQVTIRRQDQPPVTLRALFDPQRIVASEQVGQEVQTWTISRIDLSIQTAVSFSPHIRNGTCMLKIAPAKRAF